MKILVFDETCNYLSGLILLFLTIFHYANSEATVMTSDNFDALVAQHELVFINFYADWCRFSQILEPIFDETADSINKEFPQAGRVLLGKIDCDKETNIATRFRISKYPTLKTVRNGKLSKREYRGQRSAAAMIEHIKGLLKNPLLEIESADDVATKVQSEKRAMVGYMTSKDSSYYHTFRKVASDLRDECNFYVSIVNEDTANKNTVVYKPPREKVGGRVEPYTGDLQSYDELSQWASEKCIPLVRDITFENAEELTEEGLPFMILFHHPDDVTSVERFSNKVRTELMDERSSINFLTADGLKFSHPLHHLGKSVKDLPLIAIDSFRHMYLLPAIKEMDEPGRLKEFIQDLHSGKLHREFHYGSESPVKKEGTTDPPKSSFKQLAPSRNRYTLLRDEL